MGSMRLTNWNASERFSFQSCVLWILRATMSMASRLFAIQLGACSDMTWAEEKGLFSLSQRKVEAAYSQAALETIATHRFGFFPPQLLNRSRLARRIENGIEAVHALRPILPFLLLTARARE